MINQQLVDYIKQQLQAGQTKEKIAGDLLANGWNNQDIAEGFNAASAATVITPTINPNPIIDPQTGMPITPVTSSTLSSLGQTISEKPKSHISGKVFLTIFILILLGAIGFGVYYKKDQLLNLPIVQNVTSQINSWIGKEEVEVPVEAPVVKVVEKTPEPVVIVPEYNIYSDINGLYSFTYPKEAEIDDKLPEKVIVNLEPDLYSLSIIPDVNNISLNKLNTKDLEKTFFGNINNFPANKYSSKTTKEPVFYEIDLGKNNNIKTAILISVLNLAGNNLFADKVEKIIQSFVINKDYISTFSKNYLSTLNPTKTQTKPVIKTVSVPTVTTPITPLSDEQIKKIIKNLRIEAEVYYWKGETYNNFCKSSDYLNPTKAARASLACKDGSEAYSVSAKLSDGYWCVDSAGFDNKSSLSTGPACTE